MKSPKHAGKAAKNRVMYADAADMKPYNAGQSVSFWTRKSSANDETPVLVLPMPTLSAAKKRLKFERLSEGQKMRLIVKTADDHSFKRGAYGNYWNIDCARAILNLIS